PCDRELPRVDRVTAERGGKLWAGSGLIWSLAKVSRGRRSKDYWESSRLGSSCRLPAAAPARASRSVPGQTSPSSPPAPAADGVQAPDAGLQAKSPGSGRFPPTN